MNSVLLKLLEPEKIPNLLLCSAEYSLCISDCISVVVEECLRLDFFNRKKQKLYKKAGSILETVLDLPSYVTNLKTLMNS